VPPLSSRLRKLAAAALVALAAVPAASASAAEPGVQAHLLWGGDDRPAVERQLDRVAEMGATVVRVDVGWASLQQSGPGSYERWFVDRLDHVVESAHRRGIRPLLTLMESPCWASAAPESRKQGCAGAWWERNVQKYGPVDPAAYAQAAAWVAARYQGRIAGLELWNEPNHPEFFLGDDRAGRYAALVKAAYPAIKAAAPNVTVVAGALSESDLDFARALYARGIAGHYDAFAIHPYNADAAPLDPRSIYPVRGSFLRGVPAFRELQLANGDRTPLWLTESGWSTATVRAQPWVSGVDEAVQARFLEEQFAQIARWDYVAVNIWFNLMDTTTDGADLVGNYGLLRADGTPKPAFHAFKRSAPVLGGSVPVPPAPAGPAATATVGTGTKAGGGSGGGSGAAGTVLQPLEVSVSLQTGRLVVSGTVPEGTTDVTVRLHRKVGKKSAKRHASYTVKVKPSTAKKGKTVKRRFRRALPKRLARRSWRVVATARVRAARKPLRAVTDARAKKA
jgi:polysaccharide biosynthesis protein PslG